MNNDLKRRLLSEVVQDNIAALHPASRPNAVWLPPREVVHQQGPGRSWAWLWRAWLGVLCMVLLPVTELAMVTDRGIHQSHLAWHSTPVETESDATPHATESSPPPPEAPADTATGEVQSAAAPDVVGEETFPPPIPIDLTIVPLRVKKIVLDPGHGGKDAGATGPQGLREKEITLDISLRLRRLLTQAAFEVVMTREQDVTVPLVQRTTLANAQQADLFVSIHVNWIDGSVGRGIETYYLGPTGDPLTQQLAARENRDSGYSLADFRRLLDGIYVAVRRDESRRLAEMMQQNLFKALRLTNPAVVNRGTKTAPFVVLVNTGMPAILAEVACLSNPEEAQLLTTPQYRQEIAQGLFQGIHTYTRTFTRSLEKGT